MYNTQFFQIYVEMRRNIADNVMKIPVTKDFDYSEPTNKY